MKAQSIFRWSLTGIAIFASGVVSAQNPAAKSAEPSAPKPPLVGDMAPDFTLPGATRFGLLAKPVSLSEYRGKTVVLAFFFVARTKG